MEELNINGNKWKTFIGDEGQTVYIAQFTIPSEDLLGKFVDDSFYDIIIDHNADVYLPPEQDIANTDEDESDYLKRIDESCLAFKFRKNVFTLDEQEGAFDGLYSAAGESNNRGLAAGPRCEKSGNREWVTSFQQDILSYYEDGQPQRVDGANQIESLIEKHKDLEDEIRGSVWLRSKIEGEFGVYKNFFGIAMERLDS